MRKGFVVGVAIAALAAGAPAQGWSQTRPSAAASASGPPAWRAMRSASGLSVARAAGPPPLADVAFTCEGRTPVIAARLSPVPAQRVVPLAFGVDGQTVQVSAIAMGKGTWAAPLRDPRLLDLATGGATEARLFVNGRPAGVLALGGARAAVEAALPACYAPRASAPQPETTPGAKGGGYAPGPLPIRPGHYVNVGVACEKASSAMLFEGRRIHSLFRNPRESFVETIHQVAKSGPNAYDVGFVRPPGAQDDTDPGGMVVTVRGPGRIDILIQDDESLRFCEPQSLPAALSAQVR